MTTINNTASVEPDALPSQEPKPQTRLTPSADNNHGTKATNSIEGPDKDLPTGEPAIERPDRPGVVA